MKHIVKLSCCALAAAVVLGTLAVVGTAGAQTSESKAPAGDATRGRQLYYEHGCYGCHGYTGETGVQKLVGPTAPIVRDERTFIHFLRLRADFAPVTPSETMPNYSKKDLSDADARDIYAFIRTFKIDAPNIRDVRTFQAILKSAERPNTSKRH